MIVRKQKQRLLFFHIYISWVPHSIEVLLDWHAECYGMLSATGEKLQGSNWRNFTKFSLVCQVESIPPDLFLLLSLLPAFNTLKVKALDAHHTSSFWPYKHHVEHGSSGNNTAFLKKKETPIVAYLKTNEPFD